MADKKVGPFTVSTWVALILVIVLPVGLIAGPPLWEAVTGRW